MTIARTVGLSLAAAVLVLAQPPRFTPVQPDLLGTGIVVLLLGTLSISLSWRSASQAGLLQRERELALKREARFRQFLEAAPDGVVIADTHGLIQLVNAQTERMFGYTRAELAGRPVEVLMPARDYRNRHASILLAWDATLAAFDEASAAA